MEKMGAILSHLSVHLEQDFKFESPPGSAKSCILHPLFAQIVQQNSWYSNDCMVNALLANIYLS